MRITHISLAAGIAIATLAATMPPASAGRVDPPGRGDNHCTAPNGTDLNAFYGVTDQIVNRVCTEVTAGEHWRVTSLWFGDDGTDSVYPAGYTPLQPRPRDDFLAKLTVEVVIDGGTPQQRVEVFPGSEAVDLDFTFDQFVPGAPPYPVAVTIPRLRPLSPGEHTRELRWVLSAEHCDGLTAVREESCIPAGEVSLGGVQLVTATRPATS